MVQSHRFINTTKHFLNAGFLSLPLSAFLLKLQQRGYAQLTLRGYADSVAHFAEWARRAHLTMEDLGEAALVRFSKHRCGCPGGRQHRSVSPKYVRRVRRFIRYLQEQGLVAKAPSGPAARSGGPLAGEFIRWLCAHRGIGPVTVRHYIEQLNKLPQWLLHPVSAGLSAARIRSWVIERAAAQSTSAIRYTRTTLRMYLRFLGTSGRCPPGLEGAIPSIPQWQLSALPRYLPPEHVERLIASCDRRTLLGKRDRAVLLLLARLGLRAGDIAGMRLQDIDWHAARLKVCGKGRREIWLPLPQEAGDAMLEYLKRRAAVALDRVFLCMQAPHRPLQPSGPSSIVARALCRSGIHNPPSKGATLLRHSAATSMLRAGATLDAVSSLLRHRSLNMTTHYAKVDLLMLEQIVQPWPEGLSC